MHAQDADVAPLCASTRERLKVLEIVKREAFGVGVDM
jgi:hypothetical protein